MPSEEPISVPTSDTSDSTSVDTSSCLSIFPSGMPTEEPISVTTPEPCYPDSAGTSIFPTQIIYSIISENPISVTNYDTRDSPNDEI